MVTFFGTVLRRSFLVDQSKATLAQNFIKFEGKRFEETQILGQNFSKSELENGFLIFFQTLPAGVGDFRGVGRFSKIYEIISPFFFFGSTKLVF